MWVIYDKEADVLRMGTGQGGVVMDTSSNQPGLAVGVATECGYDVVDFELLGASVYLPLGRGYDAERDILTIGDSTDDPELVTEGGDLVAFWKVDEMDPDGFLVLVGLDIRHASRYLKRVLSEYTEWDYIRYTVKD